MGRKPAAEPPALTPKTKRAAAKKTPEGKEKNCGDGKEANTAVAAKTKQNIKKIQDNGDDAIRKKQKKAEPALPAASPEEIQRNMMFWQGFTKENKEKSLPQQVEGKGQQASSSSDLAAAATVPENAFETAKVEVENKPGETSAETSASSDGQSQSVLIKTDGVQDKTDGVQDNDEGVPLSELRLLDFGGDININYK